MPRDASGVYTLPVGNPVVTNTVITSTWANTTLSDIAAQLNNVYTRDGLLGPTGPFKIVDGTVGAPGLAFNSEPGLGWYRPTAGNVHMASGGQQTFRFGTGPASSAIAISPRATGLGELDIYHDPATSSGNTDYFALQKNATGTRFVSVAVGTGTVKGFSFEAASSDFKDHVVNITTTNQAAQLVLRRPAGHEANIITQRNGLTQWRLVMGDGTAAGDLHLQRYDDAGTNLGTPIGINRLTGLINTSSMQVNGNFSSQAFFLTGQASSWTADASNVYLMMASAWGWIYNKSTGSLQWWRNSGGLPSTTFAPDGDLINGRNIFAGTSLHLALIGDAAGERYLRFNSDGWRLRWLIANGNFEFCTSAGFIVTSINASGVLYAPGGLLTAGEIRTTSNSTGAINVDGGGGNGACIRLHQAGVGIKFLRCLNNNFEVMNDTFSFATLRVSNGGRVEANEGYLSKQGTGGGYGVNTWNWFWNTDNHLYCFVDNTNQGWPTFNSDERIKQNITPLALDTDSFLALRPIYYEYREVAIYKADGVGHWGFSAQNVEEAMPYALVGSTSAVQENGDPQPAGVDTTPIVAQMVLQVQDLINRVRQLETA